MNQLSCIVLLTIIFGSATFALRARGIFNNPKNPGKCTINDNLVLSPGDIVSDPDLACGRIICAELGLALFYSCNMEVPKGCELTGYIDKTLPYPDCCKIKTICL